MSSVLGIGLTNITEYTLLLSGLFCLIYLQNSRSIYTRLSGLIVIFLTAVAHYIITGFSNPAAPIVLSLLSILLVLGFLSDFYSATLRTWFFGVSNESMRTTTYSLFISLFLLPFVISFLSIADLLLFGTVVGALIGEIRYSRQKSFSKISKSVLGTVVGLYGMATKIIFGIQMINLIVIFS
ncbi:MAG: DUF456 domain-containing protein [Candidatus Sericytochromatia bacterium]|nr:DUF456 domain-containing protein [Candidatus Sericytochromatia bacterium]